MAITAVILTFNEARHIARAIASAKGIAEKIVVIDSGSTDDTVEIAQSLKAHVMCNMWTNYAGQLNWALDRLPNDTEWVLRLDADEIVTPELASEVQSKLHAVSKSVNGIYVSRRIVFLGRPIRHGGLSDIRVLRLFRHGNGRCESRWMDEHIKVTGETVEFDGEIIDQNLNSLSWWTQKHNNYASREVVDLLNLEYRFAAHETVADLRTGQQAGVKRWIKENVYAKSRGGLRAGAYFVYRYIFQLGFLDGREGAIFHVLQGFWYRFLVDAKLLEVRKYMKENRADVVTAIDRVLGIDVR